MKTIVNTPNAPKAIGPYAQAVTAGTLVFTSGQIALDPQTGMICGDTIEEQTHRVCQNLREVLTAAGSSLSDTVKTVCYLSDMAHFAAFNEIYAQYFTTTPARSCVQAARLPKDALVEIDVIALSKHTAVCG